MKVSCPSLVRQHLQRNLQSLNKVCLSGLLVKQNREREITQAGELLRDHEYEAEFVISSFPVRAVNSSMNILIEQIMIHLHNTA